MGLEAGFAWGTCVVENDEKLTWSTLDTPDGYRDSIVCGRRELPDPTLCEKTAENEAPIVGLYVF